MIVTATAGWSIPRTSAAHFSTEGSHLQRYSRLFRGVEINTSFYRNHAADTYAGWARQTPRAFRFSVKLPRQITHELRLRAARRPLQAFIAGVTGLGSRLGPLIVQLPPSLAFETRPVATFFTLLRELHEGPVVCEPRHASWFGTRAEALLERHRVGRIGADPAIVPAAAEPGGWPGIVYYRLHGSPRKYWSVYQAERLEKWAEAMNALPRRTQVWCVFDNTASGGAAANALQMKGMTKT